MPKTGVTGFKDGTRSTTELPTIPVRIPRGLVTQVDALVEQGIFASRSQGCVALITAGLTHLPEITRAKAGTSTPSDLPQMRSGLDYWEAFGGGQTPIEFMTNATGHEAPWSEKEIATAAKEHAETINQTLHRSYATPAVRKIGEQLAGYIKWDQQRASQP
jgi:Arc/MetJ-type ribon-helix-helix transcriptional regulator